MKGNIALPQIALLQATASADKVHLSALGQQQVYHRQRGNHVPGATATCDHHGLTLTVVNSHRRRHTLGSLFVSYGFYSIAQYRL